jgi:hypothetical protein
VDGAVSLHACSTLSQNRTQIPTGEVVAMAAAEDAVIALSIPVKIYQEVAPSNSNFLRRIDRVTEHLTEERLR